MQCEETDIEVVVVPEAIGHTFECFDFVVDSLDHGGGDRFVVVGQDTACVLGDGQSEFNPNRSLD